jgi:EAL domain-containing protein (putative c-di-GMP-specific phosphodiesterase class I)
MFEFIEKMFSIYKISPRKICFEVTETWEVKDKISAVILIKKLQSIWCEVAIDDFWRWNSSAEKLYDGDYDIVKTDWKYIKWLLDKNWKVNRLYKMFIANVCEVSRMLWLKVVAEYVNWKETEKVLREIWVDYFQWYESSWEPIPLANYKDKKE